MKKQFSALLLALVITVTALAQGMPGAKASSKGSDVNAQVPLDRKVRYGKLDNGFTYYIRANKKPENRIQFRLVSNAGSILEREDQRGLAHFCEHMAFNGIKGYPHNEMISKLQEHGVAFGSHVNAYTSFDETVYFVNLPSDDPEMVKMGLEILDGWAGNILFDQKEIESERGVIHEEWRGNRGAGDRIVRKLLPIEFKGSLYAERMPIGLESVIMNFERQAIVDFFNDWYRPDLQAIVIVGDIPDIKAMEKQVKEVFGAHRKVANPKERKSFSVPANVEPLVAIATDKEQTSTSLEFTWKHPKAHNGTIGDYRQSLVRSLINMMINDRLRDICEKPTVPMMYASARYGGFIGRDLDQFSVSTAPKEGRIEEAAEQLLTIMKQVDDHGFLQAELDRQKEELLSWYTKSAKEENKTENNSLADEYTRHFLTGEPVPGIRQEWKYAKEFIPGITLEECNQLVSTWITDENMIIELIAPEKPDVKIPTEQALLDIVKKTKSVTTEPWVDNFKEEPLFTETIEAITPDITNVNEELDYTEYTCPNGIRFIVKKTELKADEIQFTSFSFGGTSLYSDEEYFQAANAASFIGAGGIADFSATQLGKKLKGMNLSISPYISDEVQGFSGSCSPKDLETTLQLLNLYYTAPRKDEDAYQRNIENSLNQIKNIRENPQVVFVEKFVKTAYPNSRRTIVIPTEAQVKGLSLDRMYEIYRERFADASAQTFFFVGNVSDENIKMIANYLNHLPVNGTQKNEKYINRNPKFAEGIQHAEAVKGMERQGMLIVSGQTVCAEPLNDPQTRIAIDMLSEAVQITVLEVLREKNGDAYSPSASFDYSLMPESTVSWQFYIGCDPEKTKKIEKDCIKILKQYIKKGPDEKTLEKVKKQMIVDRGNARQNNSFWLNQIRSSYMLNESRDFIEQYNDMVNAVTVKDLKALAKQYINLKNYIAVSLRPESSYDDKE